MTTYSFMNFNATLDGPGGVISLGAGAGVAEEGFTIEFSEDADTMKTGADGTPVHSLSASKAGKLTLRLMKTSPTNALLSAMYNFQRTSPANWGQNVFTATDTVRGDVYTCQLVAFTRFPKNDYAKEAGLIEWDFNAGIIDPSLAAGL
ncbi:DUF3277 family protein [Paraburkholderia sp. D15]|uniref:phage protein n=1 Tax=Paraburkholderia sp. D15 TaxID=2880218 RepID=UPI00247AC1BA|nr:phage protein [Paraburkholderia sp. D15]WGS52673.1 DUF3277 family protein [Paraburkholderia sp. D15]WKF61907.1 hypothetical protein HUO10_006439 [Paraburkholderia busanensis]